MDDNLLIKKVKSGDKEAFYNIVKKYEKKAYNISYRLLRNPEDAKDVSQESFIKVYKSIGSFKEESSFSTWFYTIVNNTAKDYIRKKYKIREISIYKESKNEEDYVIEIEDTENSPEKILDNTFIRDNISEAIKKLSFEHRQVIVYREIQELSYDEISEILNCSIGTVKSRLNRARKNLRDILNSNQIK